MNKGAIRSFGIFAVVIIILADLTIGGIYFAKNRSQAYEPKAQDEGTSSEVASEEAGDTQQDDATTFVEDSSEAVENTVEGTQAVGGAGSSDIVIEQNEELADNSDIASTGYVPETGAGDLLLVIPLLMTAVFLVVHLVRDRILLVEKLLS